MDIEYKTLYKAAQNIDPFVAQYPELKRIADKPMAAWASTPNAGERVVRDVTTKAKLLAQIPTIVLYYMVNRDGGDHSAGGAVDAADYMQWIDKIVANTMCKSIFIVEPDALCKLTDVTTSGLIEYAITRLKTTGSKVFIDIGNTTWLLPGNAVDRLRQAGIAQADGFSLNVSNFKFASDNHAYAKLILTKLNDYAITGKEYVIDTGRCGNGPLLGADKKYVWCNPSGRALGWPPQFRPDKLNPDCYAYLWIKPPGNSDGSVPVSAPAAGQFWLEYAQELIRNSK